MALVVLLDGASVAVSRSAHPSGGSLTSVNISRARSQALSSDSAMSGMSVAPVRAIQRRADDGLYALSAKLTDPSEMTDVRTTVIRDF